VTIAEAIAEAAARLAARQVPEPRRNAEVLLGHVLDHDRAWLVAHYHDGLDDRSRQLYELLLDRRAEREPVQYITGMQEFWGIEFTVSPDVLIPRPETELVVETAAGLLTNIDAPVLVDLCTGSGCIAVSLAKELPGARIFAVDRSEPALAVARKNAQQHGTGRQIRFLEGDLFEPLRELQLADSVDAVTANPPYIAAGELAALQPEVRDFEPEMALLAGSRGTEVAERITAEAPAFLKRGGVLVMEMGIGQADALRSSAASTNAYDTIEVLKDLAGIERVIVAKKK
jgi:release factor glutamine methyltransferase